MKRFLLAISLCMLSCAVRPAPPLTWTGYGNEYAGHRGRLITVRVQHSWDGWWLLDADRNIIKGPYGEAQAAKERANKEK